MKKDKEKASEADSSSKAALERGKEAIKADEKINKKDKDTAQVKSQEAKDAEQWRNEG